MRNSTSLRPLGLYDYRRYISNERFAHALVRKIRWSSKVQCPRCKSTTIWKMDSDFRCKMCSYHFSVISGTVFEGSRLKLSQWIMAIGLFRIGINGLGLQWALGCSYPTARRVLHTLRTVVAHDPLIQQLQGEIEVDETYYGGRRKGKRGRGAKGKIPVLGFKQRKGKGPPKVKTIVIPDVSGDTITREVNRSVKRGSTVYSDGFKSYDELESLGYQHLPFDHSVQFVKTDVIHTQGIEGHWGVTKPGTKSRYRRITRESLPGICAENDFRTNHRQTPDFIELMLHQLLKFYPSTY